VARRRLAAPEAFASGCLKKGKHMGTILVLGGTGMFGTALAECLRKTGTDYVLGVPTRQTLCEMQDQGHRAVLADFERPETLESALCGIEGLFLRTPLVPDIANWTVRAITAARRAGVRFIVRASGCGVEAEGSCGMTRLHGALDAAVRESGIPCCLVRSAPLMQDYATHYAPMIRDTGRIFLPMGMAATALVDARDVAEGLCRILATPEGFLGRSFMFTGPYALDNVEIAVILSEIVGRRIAYVPVDDATAEYAMVRAGMAHWTIDLQHGLNAAIRSGAATQVTPDLAAILERQPVDFRTFANAYRQAWEPAYA
jgi:uncharacterized protein YbjT (DUF2867 family)